MDGRAWLTDVCAEYRRNKGLCERAAEQLSDESFFALLGGGPNSVAIQMKHVGENMRSRWRDFLTTDGEKADRAREDEFVADGAKRAEILAIWDEGWRTAFANLEALGPDDLGRTVTIRGEPHGVVTAIQRNLTHVAYHTGQLVLIARSLAGDAWRPLSIPPGKTAEFNAAMRAKHGDWEAREDS